MSQRNTQRPALDVGNDRPINRAREDSHNRVQPRVLAWLVLRFSKMNQLERLVF